MTDLKAATKADATLQAIIEALRTKQRRIPHNLYHKQGIKVELGDCVKADSLLYVRKKIFVPYNDLLRT
jgi:hypothetical protein